jgi:hypothetical protein
MRVETTRSIGHWSTDPSKIKGEAKKSSDKHTVFPLPVEASALTSRCFKRSGIEEA